MIAAHASLFLDEPLQEVLRRVFGDDTLFGKGCSSQGISTKVAVTTATLDGQANVLANYSRPSRADSFYSFSETDIKTREA